MGGGGYQQQSSSSKSSQTPYVPWQLQQLYPGITSAIGTLEQGGPGYTGPGADTGYTAPLTSQATGTIANLTNMGNNPSPLTTAASSTYADILGGKYLDPNNPLLQGYIKAAQMPTLQALDQQRLSDEGTFAAGGQELSGSSPFAYARAIAGQTGANTLGNIASSIALPAYQTAVGQLIPAAQGAAALQNQGVQQQIQILQQQYLPTYIAQLGIQNGLQLYQQQLQAIQAGTNAAVAAVRPTVLGTSQSSSSGFGFQIPQFSPSSSPSGGALPMIG